MEREIKFEYGFETVNGIVKKVYHLHEIPNIKIKCDLWNEVPIKYVRQFTGLKDKNGKEIYEGDILAFEREWSFKKELVNPFVIQWEDYGTGMVGWTQFSPRDKFVVIGNKFQNPELI